MGTVFHRYRRGETCPPERWRILEDSRLRSATVAGAMYIEDIPQDIFSHQSCKGMTAAPGNFDTFFSSPYP